MIKSNQILLGIILLLIGILSLVTYFFDISHFSVMALLGGFAFVLLYRTKRKTWSLIIGMYVIYIGFAGLFLGSANFTSRYLSPIFFILPGITFLVLYFDKNKKGLLFPGGLLLWVGIYMILRYGLSIEIEGLFATCMASAFINIYFMNKDVRSKGILLFGILLYCVAIISFLSIPFNKVPLGAMPPIASVLLIFLSITIIVRSVIMKK